VSASVNLPLHHKVPKFFSGTGSPGWSWKKGHKTDVVFVCFAVLTRTFLFLFGLVCKYFSVVFCSCFFVNLVQIGCP